MLGQENSNLSKCLFYMAGSRLKFSESYRQAYLIVIEISLVIPSFQTDETDDTYSIVSSPL